MKKQITIVASLIAVAIGVASVNGAYAAPFLPSNLSGLSTWLDAGNIDGSNNSTLTNGQIMSAVNVGGDGEIDWVDAGSQSLGTWQAVPGTRDAHYIASGVNGQPVVRFDGGDDIVLVNGAVRPELFASVSDDVTMFFVSDLTGGANGALMSTRGSGNDGWTMRQVDNDSYRFFFTGHNADVQTDGTGTGFHVAELLRDGDAPLGQATLTLGVDANSTNTDTGTNGFTAENQGTAIGRNRTGGGGFTGDIAEIIIFDRLLSASEANQVGFYLEEKYGLDTGYVNPAPEPNTLILATLGLLSLGVTRRRRRR